jgi:hypothetical protein
MCGVVAAAAERIGGAENDDTRVCGVESLGRAIWSLRAVVDDSTAAAAALVSAIEAAASCCNCCTKKNNLRLSGADDTPSAAKCAVVRVATALRSVKPAASKAGHT